MTRGSFTSGFTALDSTERPQDLLDFLDDVGALDAVVAAKREATAAMELRPSERALDIGCGTGVDLPEILAAISPGGRVVGIDVSERAVGAAAARVPEAAVQVADVQELPFADGSFEACRADRTLQHVADPERALAEIHRVLVPGGRLVVLEVLAALQTEGALGAASVTKAVLGRFSTEDERRQWLGFLLPLLLRRAGFTDVRLTVTPREQPGFAAVDATFRLTRHVGELVADGAVHEDEAAEWLDGVRAAASDDRVAVRFDAITLLARREP